MVSTDDDEIASTARSYGAEIPFMRPGALAADDTSKWAVFRHFVREIDNKLGLCPEVIVDLDTGVPLREPSDIEACLRLLVSSEADLAITGYRADRNPYFNMVEVDDAGFAKISKPPPRPFVRRQDAPDVYGLSPAVYAIRTSALWKYDHWSLAKFRLSLMPRERAIDIDTEFDFRLVECLIETRTGTPATQEHS
jgi:N-acylneuraminate cytidylyltransferase/CMP-N,N'-diacetyllegionaminic acid synthase